MKPQRSQRKSLCPLKHSLKPLRIFYHEEHEEHEESVDELKGIHEAQLLTYMKLANIRQGFLINFNVKRLKEGLKSFIL